MLVDIQGIDTVEKGRKLRVDNSAVPSDTDEENRWLSEKKKLLRRANDDVAASNDMSLELVG
jgi:hypothetical protein